MNVAQLIELLKHKDPNLMVVRHGYEGGYNEVCDIENIKINLNVNTSWYYDEHDDDGPEETRIEAVCI